MSQELAYSQKRAIVIGGSGLVGSALVMQLLADTSWGKVISLGRRTVHPNHPRLEEHIIDFDQPDTWRELVRGDVLFSCLGTTRSQAGGTSAQYKVDYTYQWEAAKAAAQNKVPTYVLVSSVGADATSAMFYLRMKGELDNDVQKLSFKTVHILRPGPLDGPREKVRTGERFGVAVTRFLNNLGLFKSYRPITGAQVAYAMRMYANDMEEGRFIHDSNALFLV